AKIAAEREERERRERADAAAKAEAKRARDAKRAATRRDLAAARLAEARTALERRNEPSRIVIDVANVGHWNASSDSGVTFNWDQVAEVFQYYKRKGLRPSGFLSVHTNNRNPMPRNWPFKDCVAVAAGRDGERDVDDRFLLHQSKEHHCSIVTNDNFRGWEERLPDEDAAFLERFRNELHVNYVFVGPRRGSRETSSHALSASGRCLRELCAPAKTRPTAYFRLNLCAVGAVRPARRAVQGELRERERRRVAGADLGDHCGFVFGGVSLLKP
ncbi:unnamed protein product, partial [Pelagomonas calceolata]